MAIVTSTFNLTFRRRASSIY